MINNVKIFSNDNIKSMEIKNVIENKLINNGFKMTNNNYDLGIAIGGDGSFLRMVHKNKFNSKICYVGINSGTLGFSQDVNVRDIDIFIQELKNNKFSIEEVCVEETIIKTIDKEYKLCSLNEIVIRKSDLKTIKFDINIDGNFLEKYTGDALLISTPFGSTGENLSYNGSVVYNIPSLQITPIGPINSSKYKTLKNSILVSNNCNIELTFNDLDIYVISDGKKKKYKNVLKIITKVRDDNLKFLRLSNYNFESKINTKMLN